MPEPVVPAKGPPPVADILQAAPSPLRRRRHEVQKKPSWLGWGLLAASVAAVGLGIQIMGPSEPDLLAVHEAGDDRVITVTLGDGSFVRLAPGARLDELDVEGRRGVTLEGRAFFAVARDESRK